MFNLSISALDKKVFEGQAESLTLPGAEGELTILQNHIPLITSLNKGRILIKTEKKEDINFPIQGGVLEVSPSKVIVLANL